MLSNGRRFSKSAQSGDLHLSTGMKVEINTVPLAGVDPGSGGRAGRLGPFAVGSGAACKIGSAIASGSVGGVGGRAGVDGIASESLLWRPREGRVRALPAAAMAGVA